MFDSIGHTTRSPSTYMVNGKVESEQDGVQYHFVDSHTFEDMQNKVNICYSVGFTILSLIFCYIKSISRNHSY